MIRTRIAPSPTGDPHIGTAYIGLVNMAFARKHGGQFILRIDDTDQARYRTTSEAAIVEALHWLGLSWDAGPDIGGPAGPYRQSERLPLYVRAVNQLVAAGQAYPCFCSKERLEQVRSAQAARKETPKYDRLCREMPKQQSQDLIARGDKYVIRLAMPLDGETIFTDHLRGDIKIKNAGLQDQILLKEDGFPTYHLATCVDDHLMQITHIIRAEEWISSAPIHRVLFDYLGYQAPVFCHMPLIRNNDKDKTKISKRKNSTSILSFRDAGYHPEAMVNFLGLLGGCGPKKDGVVQEIFTLDEMIQDFDLKKIRLGGPVFDQKKLKFLNSSYQRSMDDEAYYHRMNQFLNKNLRSIAKLVKPRTENLGDFLRMADFFLMNVDASLMSIMTGLKGKYTLDAIKTVMTNIQETFDQIEPWTTETITQGIAAVTQPQANSEILPKDIMMMLRLAICGKAATPPLAESMEILGKGRCLGRIGDVLRSGMWSS